MNRIRVIAIGVIMNPDRPGLLVFEGIDSVTGRRYCRPLGGGVEFGELGCDTLRREMHEELGVEITGVRYLGTLENLFSVNGKSGHEIVLVYQAELRDAALYAQEHFEGVEDDGSRHPYIGPRRMISDPIEFGSCPMVCWNCWANAMSSR